MYIKWHFRMFQGQKALFGPGMSTYAKIIHEKYYLYFSFWGVPSYFSSHFQGQTYLNMRTNLKAKSTKFIVN